MMSGPGKHSGALHPRDQQEPRPRGPGHDEGRVQGPGHQAQPRPDHRGPADKIEDIE